ncbi:ParB/RepB/Spo0J family partition protein [Neptuniibacter sp. CAU 1671]|uniref:ParB/RepB/Spo0J family partition protein n=1 Tax=Neptuniibacter sp. CAU 1671 TaxID=3032593 RepID=UPI0023D99657|nr:ParB/RepB/Spo0J family partition protein [Neptuniibacter sp. CAU 1671]MDF2182550.1 ParB/RepB/Spo0J family partition protein [Neptuniibacter sp. CAU 1671]
MAKKRGLGRGLDALLSSVTDVEHAVSAGATENLEGYNRLSVNLIQRGRYQPRRDMDPVALEELANSIRAQGVMQPIIVRPIDTDRYEIIAGERRWRASQMADLTEIPAIIRDVPDEAAIAMALIENIQRENLNPIEEAVSLQRLQDEFELTQQEVADAVGKSRSTVTNLLRLMNLSDGVKKLLECGDLEMGHARALLALADPLQYEAAQDVVGKGLSVRQTEALVKALQQGDHAAAKKIKPEPSPQLSQLASELSQRFSAKVAISENAKGKGKITINYDSAEVLESILQQLR